jgi:MerR family mercuric resistance operon transcriptional regulator
MDALSPRLAIGTLAKRTGSRVETIRYYEHVGMLPRPPRSPGGYRLYGIEDLKRLLFIRRARALGFSIAEVRRLLGLADERRRPCAEARVIAAAHLEAVRTKIADLRTMERVLADTIVRCEAGIGTHCALIDELYRDVSGTTPNRMPRRGRVTFSPAAQPRDGRSRARNGPAGSRHRKRTARVSLARGEPDRRAPV